MYKLIKLILDKFLAIVLLVLISPIYFFVYSLIFFNLGNPVVFKQERIGVNNKRFQFYKFRTMSNETDSKGTLLPDMKRLTSLGSFLRKTSIDELPQIINIIKGDMSFIGPRPLLSEYLSKYTENQKRRHNVKPGITGLAQVKGRNTISWEKRFEYDLYYVDNLSVYLDIKILLMTIVKVIIRSDVNHNENITMEKFKGI